MTKREDEGPKDEGAIERGPNLPLATTVNECIIF